MTQRPRSATWTRNQPKQGVRRAIPLASLTGPQRRIVSALLEAANVADTKRRATCDEVSVVATPPEPEVVRGLIVGTVRLDRCPGAEVRAARRAGPARTAGQTKPREGGPDARRPVS